MLEPLYLISLYHQLVLTYFQDILSLIPHPNFLLKLHFLPPGP
jgi:hypothetical protein